MEDQNNAIGDQLNEFNAYADVRVVEKTDTQMRKSETFASCEDSDEYPAPNERSKGIYYDQIALNQLSSSTGSFDIDEVLEMDKNDSKVSHIERYKIQVMQKIKTKKLKKRLSMNNKEQLMGGVSTKI
jgi:hypothetical protein